MFGTTERKPALEKYQRLIELLAEARTIAGSLPTSVDHMALAGSIAQAKALAAELAKSH